MMEGKYYPKIVGLEIESYRVVNIPLQAVKFTRYPDNLFHFSAIISGSFKDVFTNIVSFLVQLYSGILSMNSIFLWLMIQVTLISS